MAAGLTGAAAQGFFARHKLPLGIQLYTLGPDAQKDLDGTLRQVAAIGYRTVELAGLYGKTPAEFRAALDRAELSAPSAHLGAKGGQMTFGDDPGRLAADLHTIGVKTAVLPAIAVPERLGGSLRNAGQMTADEWKGAADFLNAKAKALEPAGIRVGYHNHNYEFAPVGSTNGIEILIRNTDPALVTFEADIGWVAASGADPYAFLAAHKGRVTMMHVKDLKADSKPNFTLTMDPAEIGSGFLDWPRLLNAAYAAGVRGFFVEQEPPFTRPRIEAARISHDYLAQVKA
jgi:sugar phosphate isomerase/epimerase